MSITSEQRNWLLRFSLASVFIFHGIGKLAGPGSVGGFAEMMNLPLAAAWLVTLAEIGGGLGIIAGGLKLGPIWLNRLSGLVLIPVMLGAIALVHWPRWNFVPSSLSDSDPDRARFKNPVCDRAVRAHFRAVITPVQPSQPSSRLYSALQGHLCGK